MAYRKAPPIEYDPRDVQERIDVENVQIHMQRSANKERAEVVAMREAAQDYERKAAELRDEINGYFLPDKAMIGAGGEVSPDPESSSGELKAGPDITEIDAIQRTASLHRLEALAKADAFALGVDLAESIEARNAVEKCMAHQQAAAHALALRLMSKATVSVHQCADWVPVPKQQAQGYTAARLAGSAARLMDAFSRSAEAMHKLRGGNTQNIIVQHIRVTGDGKAVINGSADVRGRGRESDT